MEKKYLDLIQDAFEISESAYCPYSNYQVGAALLCKNGKIYKGCNIESASYSPTICAERVAFVEAVKNGERDFEAIAVVAISKNTDKLEMSSPCGVCRQFMSEFCKDDFKIIMSKLNKNGDLLDSKILSMKEILPDRFLL